MPNYGTRTFIDSFRRAPTSAGGAGTSTGLGNGWLDVNGSIWNLNAFCQAHSVNVSDQFAAFALRPVGEAKQNLRQRIWMEAINNTYLIARYIDSTNYYFCRYGGGAIFIQKTVTGDTNQTLASISTDALPEGGFLEFDVQSINGSETRLTVSSYGPFDWDTPMATVSFVDDEVILQDEGQWGFSVFAECTVNCVEMWEPTASAGMTVTSPQRGQVIQRASSGPTRIHISGRYEGTPSYVTARGFGLNFGEGDDVDFADGVFSGYLDIPEGTVGAGTVRVYDSNVTIDVDCFIGEVFALAGQSNAQGSSPALLDVSANAASSAGFLSAANVWESMDGDPIAKSYAGSFWPSLASALTTRLNLPVGFVQCAVSGTPISAWQPDDVNYERLVNRINFTHGVRAMLWYQGEAHVEMSEEDYTEGLNGLVNGVFAEAGCKTMVAQIHLVGTGLRAAVEAVRAGNANVFTVGPDMRYLETEIHIEEAEKMWAGGALWFEALMRAIYDPPAEGGGISNPIKPGFIAG